MQQLHKRVSAHSVVLPAFLMHTQRGYDCWFETIISAISLQTISRTSLWEQVQGRVLCCGEAQLFRHAGDVFYVVEEGNFTIYDDDENELARVGKGTCFGELALLRQVHRRCKRATHTHSSSP